MSEDPRANDEQGEWRSGRRVALVLSGGGARGAYEAGVLSYLFEHVYPKLPPGFEFDVVSGTSVGAIHAAFVAASAHLEPAVRARALRETWQDMTLDHVMRVRALDIAAIPLRALGLDTLMRGRGEAPEVLGGLVDISPLERLVAARIPWSNLRENLDQGRPGALCVACTEIQTGVVTVFLDGPLGDPAAWDYDPYVAARTVEISPLHVRASAAIPFLFPAVRIGESYFLDGGLRVNTPLSPVLRLAADKVLVIGLRGKQPGKDFAIINDETAITQPAFLLGKVLNVLLLDQLEHELKRLETINALLEGATELMGPEGLARLNVSVREKRGVDYRHVDACVVRPSQDVGSMCADAYRHHRERSGAHGFTAAILARAAVQGVPDTEADLLSYIYFDSSFTRPLMDLGWQDARREEDAILALLGE
jgi:NTE family protein